MQNQLKQEDFTPEELERCEKDPVYFYNKYCKVFDQHGNEIPKKPATQEEHDFIIKNCELMRNGLPPTWNLRSMQYPLLPNEMFKNQ